MSTFTAAHASKLTEYVHMSGTAGSRSDYVQGGGGNTSVKADNKLMAIKASGFRLDQITSDNAYAVIDYAAVRAFYENTDPAKLADVEKEGSAQAKAATLAIEGLPQLRPSVEVGFHSLLDTFVLHTHPVYANLATCSAEGAVIAAEALEGLPESHAFVADPARGSRHNRGCAVDLTLYDLKTGKPVEMPSRYDEFSDRAYADFIGGTTRQRALRAMLRDAMTAQGFEVYTEEWWHFDYRDWRRYGIGTKTFTALAAQGPAPLRN